MILLERVNMMSDQEIFGSVLGPIGFYISLFVLTAIAVALCAAGYALGFWPLEVAGDAVMILAAYGLTPDGEEYDRKPS